MISAGKIGWTTASETTFIGVGPPWRPHLMVTILHCKPLDELTYAARLLDWGFAEDGKVKPVGILVPPLPAAHGARTQLPVPPGRARSRRWPVSLPGSRCWPAWAR